MLYSYTQRFKAATNRDNESFEKVIKPPKFAKVCEVGTNSGATSSPLVDDEIENEFRKAVAKEVTLTGHLEKTRRA